MPDIQIPAYWLYGERRDGRFPDALHIETIETRSSIYDWQIQPHRHQEMYQFLMIESGGGVTRIDGANAPLGPGIAILLPPLVVHEFAFTVGTKGFVASVAKGSIRRFLKVGSGTEASLSQPLLLRLKRSDEKLKALRTIMRSAMEEFATNRVGRDSALSAHAELIAIWFARAAQLRIAVHEDRKNLRVDLVRRFVELVETNYRSNLSLAHFAAALGISVPHLSRVCRQIVGQPAARIIQDRLMMEARRDLVYTAMPISQIAFRLGFSDPAYFTRFFTTRAGKSPSAYRAAG